MTLTPEITVRLANHDDIHTCWLLWRQSSYNYPNHQWLHQFADQYPEDYEECFKATMKVSIQRSCSTYGRVALVAEVQGTILALGIWRRMSHDTPKVPFEALNVRKVNEIITREFGEIAPLSPHLAYYHAFPKSWRYMGEDRSIVGSRSKFGESFRQDLYLQVREASVLEPEGVRERKGTVAKESRWVLDYMALHTLSAYSRDALLAIVKWGARIATEENIDAYAEVDQREMDIMVKAGFEAFLSVPLIVPEEENPTHRRFFIMKLKRTGTS